MDNKNDKLSVVSAGMDVMTDFVKQLSDNNVLYQQFREFVADPDRFDELVALIRRPTTRVRELSVEHGALAGTLVPERVAALVASMYDPVQMARFYIDPTRLDQLLSGLRGPVWRRAAIVMTHGLGADGRAYSRAEIADMFNLSKLTVDDYLGSESLSRELNGLHRRVEATLEKLSDRDLPQETIKTLRAVVDARSVPTVSIFTQQEIEDAYQAYLSRTGREHTQPVDQVLADIARAGIPLYQQ